MKKKEIDENAEEAGTADENEADESSEESKTDEYN
jgi:hypothetical protein